MESLFHKAVVEQAYVKAGLYGFAASGKTVTACLATIGTVRECKRLKLDYADKPVFFVDTEGGSDFMVPLFEHFNIPLVVAKTRAFEDMQPALKEAYENGSAFILDSVTHPWLEFMQAYKRKKKRSFISFEDWAYLKERWGHFTTAFMNSPVHAFLLGRAGFEYEDTVDEETGKRGIAKTGTRMKTEGEMAFEPSLLIEMELEQDVLSGTSWNTATVRKDRWMDLQGKRFSFGNVANEGYDEKLEKVWAAFSPHIRRLNLGGAHFGVDTTRTSEDGIPASAKSAGRKHAEEKEILLEKIGVIFTEKGISGQSKEGKQQIVKDLQECFGTDSWKALEYHYGVDKLKNGYAMLHIKYRGSDPYAPIPDAPKAEEDVPC